MKARTDLLFQFAAESIYERVKEFYGLMGLRGEYLFQITVPMTDSILENLTEDYFKERFMQGHGCKTILIRL